MAMIAEPKVRKIQLLETDGIPLETIWHYAAGHLLLNAITYLFRGRNNYFAAANAFIYYSKKQAETVRKRFGQFPRKGEYRGPDFFYVNGVNRLPVRRYWVVWEEGGRFPDVIVELLSPSTKRGDLTDKKKLYERTFKTPEYFCYDPDTGQFWGWRLGPQGRYRKISPDRRGWLWSEELRLYLGHWHGEHLGMPGVFPRFYHEDGRLVFIPEEAEYQRAEAAEAEVAQLRARLARLNGKRKKTGDV